MNNWWFWKIVQEFEKMQGDYPENFRLDFAVSREQSNAKGEKMYIQTRMAEYAEELWQLLQKDNTFVYMCGLKGMEKGIDEIMTGLAERDGKHFFTDFQMWPEVNSTFPSLKNTIYKYLNMPPVRTQDLIPICH